jgi:hypothetical protein
MYEKYKKELSLAKNKLLAIDFFLEKDSDYIATFGNGTTWKIDFNGKWYDNYIYISIRNEASSENILGQKLVLFKKKKVHVKLLIVLVVIILLL